MAYFITQISITKEFQEVFKHYFIYTKTLKKIKILEPEKFKDTVWLPWRETLAYLDKEDKNAITLYFKQNLKSN